MRIASLNPNDMANGEGVCVSLWLQGCEHQCKGCFNPETWDPQGGEEINREELIQEIIAAISANGIKRGFSLLGGDPLATYNRKDVLEIVRAVRAAYPHIRIFIWSGYTLQQLLCDKTARDILAIADVLIDGRFIEEKKDLTLKMRGSSNQKVWELRLCKDLLPHFGEI